MSTRRHFLQAGLVSSSLSCSGWLGRLAHAAADGRTGKPKRSCILLWMSGGPATIDLWDRKVDHENGGPFKEIATNAPGLRIGEHLPKIAGFGKQLAVIRGMSTKEGDHGRGTYLMRTGVVPSASGIQYPSIGAIISKEIGDPLNPLPNFVSIGRQRIFGVDGYGSGFLGPQHAPLVVGENSFGQSADGDIEQKLKVNDLERAKSVDEASSQARLEMLRQVRDEFASSRPGMITRTHEAAYTRALQLMQSDGGKVFDLSTENAATRDRYGRNLFGQGCLLARRLVEKGVAFVEVSLGNWDTHQNNFDLVKDLCTTLDTGWSALMSDLTDRGLLDSTTIICMGEFGRTPKINGNNGRDHFSNAWSTVLAGGGVKGGQAFGRTSKDGTTVEEHPVSSANFLATVCKILGIDHENQNMSNVGRPIPIAERSATPVLEVVA